MGEESEATCKGKVTHWGGNGLREQKRDLPKHPPMHRAPPIEKHCLAKHAECAMVLINFKKYNFYTAHGYIKHTNASKPSEHF